MKRIFLKTFKWVLIVILCCVIFLIAYIQYAKYKLTTNSPTIPSDYVDLFELESLGEDIFIYGNNWAKRNEYGIWEVLIQGDNFERGVAYGKLIKHPIQDQEQVFVNQINKVLPSNLYQILIKNFIYIFLSDINDYISEELKMEILGVSLSFSDDYDYIGEKYLRVLAYHAAHDLGHALNNYSIVGCTSFSVNGEYTEDGNIIHARNFDFYFGDDFAKERVVLMVQPDTGYSFISYSWPGMMGVVSGMNQEGLAVTINASVSSPPLSAQQPISILVREILQFSQDINEAQEYLKDREVFVSESIMISSAKDNRTVIIEKSPEKSGIYENDQIVVCSNHFQSDSFVNDSINIENIINSDSKYRYDRIMELLDTESSIDIHSAISILRNRNGLGNINIGNGNPKAINQLLAHHGVVFEPSKNLMWISTPPYQLGDFICYNLDSIFSKDNQVQTRNIVNIIPEDSFLHTIEYANFYDFKKIKDALNDYILFNTSEPSFNTQEFITLNPDSYDAYFVLGRYFYKKQNFIKAKEMFNLSLERELPSILIEKEINNYITLCSE